MHNAAGRGSRGAFKGFIMKNGIMKERMKEREGPRELCLEIK